MSATSLGVAPSGECLRSKGRYGSCGWQLKLCDPPCCHGPYLSALEMRFMTKRYTNRRSLLFLLLQVFSGSRNMSLSSLNETNQTLSADNLLALYRGLKVTVYMVDKTELHLARNDLVELVNVSCSNNSTSLPRVIWEEGRVATLSHTYAVKSPLVTMARPKFAPKSTPFRGPIAKPHYLPHPWTRPTYDAKRHPDPIRRFSTMD